VLSYLSLKRRATVASAMHVMQYRCQTRCSAKLLTLNEAAERDLNESQKVSRSIPTLPADFDSDATLTFAEASAARIRAVFRSG